MTVVARPSASVDTVTKRDVAVVSLSDALGVTRRVEVLYVSTLLFLLVDSFTHIWAEETTLWEGVTISVLVVG